MEDPDPSVHQWRNQLFNSLKCTGTLDSLKSQLRARLLDQLRDQDGTLLEFKGNRKPSTTERILSSLFLDYLTAYGYSFTQSVFLPESQAVSWPAFTFKEMSQLLHLDPTASFHHCLKIGPQEKGCLAQQLVMMLQQMPFRTSNQDSSTQTRPQGSRDLDSCLREIDDSCLQKKTAERQMTFRTLEEQLNTFRQEFETRVNAEVALQVKHIRDHETNAVRVEEESRYRRQLAKDCEELEQIHKTRLERIREREESLMEHLVMKEKAFEASAYEQRQKLLASITDLQDREEKVKDKEEMQKQLDNTLQEKDRILRLREEEIAQRGAAICAEAEENAQMQIKDLEEKHRSHQDQLQSDQALLAVEWAACKEDKARLENELAAAKIDKELVHSLHERLASEEKQRTDLVTSLLERLATEEEQRKLLLKKIEDEKQQTALVTSLLEQLASKKEQRKLLKRIQDFQQHTTQNMERSAKTPFHETGYHFKNDRSDYSSGNWEKSTGNGCTICQQEQRRWAKDQKKLQETIKKLEDALQDAVDRKDQASQARRSIQIQLKSSDSELLETVTLLKKTQHALELERLHHYSLRSQIASCFQLSSQDKLRQKDVVLAMDYGDELAKEACLRTSCGSAAPQQTARQSKYLEVDPEKILHHNRASSGHLPSKSTLPCTFQTKPKWLDSSLSHIPSSARLNKLSIAPSPHKDMYIDSPKIESRTNSSCTQKHKVVNDTFQASTPIGFSDLDIVDAVRKEHFPFHQGRKELKPGSEAFLWCSLDKDIKQMSGTQTGNTTGRSHQHEPAKSGCHQINSSADCSTSTAGSLELAQISAHPSPEEVIPEAKQAASADVIQEKSQSRMNYYVMGTRSMRSNGSALEIQVKGKKVKHSSHTDSQSEEERIQTDIGIFEMKFQKKVQVSRCKESEGYPSDQQGFWDPMHPECQKASAAEMGAKKSKSTVGSRDSSKDVYSNSQSGACNLYFSTDRQEPMAAQTKELQELDIERTQLEIKKLQAGDEALHILSCQSTETKIPDESGQHALSQQHCLPVHCTDNNEDTGEEKVGPTHKELRNQHSSPAHSTETVSKGTYASQLPKPVFPVEGLCSDGRQWATDKSFMDTDMHDQAWSSDAQQQIQSTLHASKSIGDNRWRRATCRQSFDLEELQSANWMQHAPNIPMQQNLVGLHTQCKQSDSSSGSQVSASEPVSFLKRTDILGGAHSEESCSNLSRKASTVRNIPEGFTSKELASESSPCWKDLQQGQDQNGDDNSGGESGLQSEQGSYSPGEGLVEWIDDLPTTANTEYLNDSDAFSIPESDVCFSGTQSSWK